MIFEYRRYDVAPGRMADLMKRFEQSTLRIWKRHGLNPAGFWVTESDVGMDVKNPTPANGSNKLNYILEWPDIAARQRGWETFTKDPEWHQVRSTTEATGALVQGAHGEIWSPTLFSMMK